MISISWRCRPKPGRRNRKILINRAIVRPLLRDPGGQQVSPAYIEESDAFLKAVLEGLVPSPVRSLRRVRSGCEVRGVVRKGYRRLNTMQA